MNLSHYTMIGSITALAAGGAILAMPYAQAQPSSADQRSGQEKDVQELTRGPVHEAFAGTVSFDPVPGVLVSTAPPDLIEEIPPDQKPVGDNITWIPGYWGWDEDNKDFLWISGVWRNLPPDRQWVPGYWADAGREWQWTSGYWGNEEAEEVVYLPKPPRTIESGPNIEAPSRNHIWVSGSWMHRQERYAWRPGYWEPAQENWVWVPACYQWTRRGYIFVDGYWDYAVPRRGVVFAPVRFHHDVYSRPNYYYRPTTVINLLVFTNHLFVRPNYGHYYFGDYYAPRYQDRGYYASYSYHSSRGYDPIYAYNRWEHRDERDWERTRRDRFEYYRTNESARPPQTWAAMRNFDSAGFEAPREEYAFAQPLETYARRTDTRQRFEPVSANDREQVVAQRKEVREFAQTRRQRESRADVRPESERGQAQRERLPQSPLVGARAENLAGGEAPPRRREVGRDENAGRSRDERQPKIGRTEDTTQGGRGREQGADRKMDQESAPGRDRETRREGGATAPVDKVQTIRPGSTNKEDRKTEAVPSQSRRMDTVPAPAPKAERERPSPEASARRKDEPTRRVDQPERKVESPAPERRERSERSVNPARQNTAVPQQRESRVESRPQPQPRREAVTEQARTPNAPRQAAPERKQVERPQAMRPEPTQARREPERRQEAAPQRPSGKEAQAPKGGAPEERKRERER